MGWTIGPPIIFFLTNALIQTVAFNATTCTDEQMALICGPTLEAPETCNVKSNTLPTACILNMTAAFKSLVVQEIEFNQTVLTQFD